MSDVATTKYPQVYRPDGTWEAMFYTLPFAKAWVKQQADATKWEISMRRPARKTSDDE